jgi:16S rRNA (uracil1498-N3)-methyltransferase
VNPALRRSAAHVFVDSLAAPFLEPDDRHHLGRVLRLRDGEVVSVSNGTGEWRLCRFADDGRLLVAGEILAEPARVPAISIGVAIPKGERPEWIVQKLTEIGVDRIIFLHAAHSVVRWEPARAARNMERLGKVAREAAMQSRRVRLVELDGPLTIGEVLSGPTRAEDHQLTAVDVALAEPDGAPLDLDRPTVLIGPEGGWSPAELAMCGATVSLGPTILRVETAALVAAARLVDLREQRGRRAVGEVREP